MTYYLNNINILNDILCGKLHHLRAPVQAFSVLPIYMAQVSFIWATAR
jgi:hypothetical protein